MEPQRRIRQRPSMLKPGEIEEAFAQGEKGAIEVIRELMSRHPGIAHTLFYQSFSPRHHIAVLDLDEAFLESVTPHTKILELGAGSGRLADYLLRKTKVDSSHYILADPAYVGRPPGLKRRVYRLWKKGVVQLAPLSYTGKIVGKYHHILLPESVLASREDLYEKLITLMRSLLPHVRAGGSLRMSYVPKPRKLEEQPPAFSRYSAYAKQLTDAGYRIRYTGGGVVIERPLRSKKNVR